VAYLEEERGGGGRRREGEGARGEEGRIIRGGMERKRKRRGRRE